MITANKLIANFPEFEEVDPLRLEAAISQTAIETNGYEGIANCAQRELALMLHACHFLSVQSRQDTLNYAGPIKRIQSRNDEVEFGDPSSAAGLEGTIYGQRLLGLLKRIATTVRYVPCTPTRT